MSDSEQPVSSGPQNSGAKPADGGNRRRGRRGGRGRRKSFAPRPRDVAGAVPPAPETSAHSPAPSPDTEAHGETAVASPTQSNPPDRPLLERVQRLAERVTQSQPAHRASAVSQAIDEVMEIIETLKRAVDQMEEVLELVELAERQKLADEREIESLRRALRQLHDRPRESRNPRDYREHRSSPETRESRSSRETNQARLQPEADVPETNPEPPYSVD